MANFSGPFKAKAPITIIGVILIGIVGSAIYDAIVKPGFGVVSKFLFGFFTLGSQRMRDSAYSNAALDPSSLPALMLLMFLAGGAVISLVLSRKSFRVLWTRPRIRGLEDEYDEAEMQRIQGMPLDEHLAYLKKKLKVLRVLRLVYWVTSLIFVIAVYIMVSTTNQSILVWRVQNANMSIIAPFITQEQLLSIKSEFSKVKTEKEFSLLYKKMEGLAAQNNVELRGDATW